MHRRGIPFSLPVVYITPTYRAIDEKFTLAAAKLVQDLTMCSNEGPHQYELGHVDMILVRLTDQRNVLVTCNIQWLTVAVLVEDGTIVCPCH